MLLAGLGPVPHVESGELATIFLGAITRPSRSGLLSIGPAVTSASRDSPIRWDIDMLDRSTRKADLNFKNMANVTDGAGRTHQASVRLRAGIIVCSAFATHGIGALIPTFRTSGLR